MARVSLIVPVYNVERYLEACLDSLCNQSYDDVEILCVNDGSTDRSAALLAAAAAEDSRIRVLGRENGGVSSARNVGIEAATGEILMFVDSDDLLEAHACETIAAAFGRTGADIVTFGASCFPEELSYPKLEECLSPRDALYEGFSMDILFEENARPYVWRSAFSREFLRRTALRFREGMAFGEDQVFHFMAYPRSKKTLLLSDKLYRYRMDREGSAMVDRGGDTSRRVGEHIEMLDCILWDWAERGWLDAHAQTMLSWTLDVVLFDLIDMEEPARTDRAREFGSVLRARFGDPRSVASGPVSAQVIEAFEKAEECGFRLGKSAMLRYYLESRGLRACFNRAAMTAVSVFKLGRRGL